MCDVGNVDDLKVNGSCIQLGQTLKDTRTPLLIVLNPDEINTNHDRKDRQ